MSEALAGAGLMTGLSLLVGGLMAWLLLGTEEDKLRARIKKTKTVLAGHAQQGAAVAVTGVAHATPAGTVRAPLCGAEVLAYRVEVYAVGAEHRLGPLLREARDQRPVEIRDASGNVLVNPAAAQLRARANVYGALSSALSLQLNVVTREVTPELRATVRQLAGPKADRFQTFQVREHVLAPGDTAYALGTVSRRSDGVHLTGTADAPLVLSSVDRDTLGAMLATDRALRVGMVGALLLMAAVGAAWLTWLLV